VLGVRPHRERLRDRGRDLAAAPRMKRAQAIARLARASESRGPVAFAVRDTAGRGSAYEIDCFAGSALVFGSASPVHLAGPGVLPAHFVVLPHDGLLVVASASAANAAMLNGAALPTSWTVLEIPSRIRVGAVAVDFFYVEDSGTQLVDQDVETTVSQSGCRPAARLGPLPRPSPPPRRRQPVPAPRHAIHPIPTPQPGAPARDLAFAIAERIRVLWTTAPTSTRVLLGVVALLLIFLLFRGPRPA
jgi:hypothetical protein